MHATKIFNMHPTSRQWYCFLQFRVPEQVTHGNCHKHNQPPLLRFVRIPL